MRVRLAYGRTGLEIDLPDANTTVVESRYVPGLPDEGAALREALRHPRGTPALRELVRPEDTVVVVFSDLTRPTPNDRLLPVLLGELAHVPDANITLLNALGMHRHNDQAELTRMLGPEIVTRYRIVNHEAYDKSKLVNLGRTASGNEVWVDGEYMRAAARILTGFIEPHLFAGFSGGAKAILPGVAGGDSVMYNHNARMIGNPKSTYGVVDGNPIFAEMREVAALARPSFLLNVTLNKERCITGVFAGELGAAHDAGIAFVRRTAMQAVPALFDVTLTTNNYYPADLDLYQSVKGMKAAAAVTKPGGAIVIAAGCEEGVGHGPFGEIMQMRDTPQGILDMIYEPGFAMFDQWEAQELCKILVEHPVYLHTDGLSEAQTRAAHLIPTRDVAATVRALLAQAGPHARLGVMPEGPQTVPYVG